MKKTLLILTALFTIPSAYADTPDITKGEKLFKRSCATCHGKQGEKKAFNQSAIINQLNQEQIVMSLQDRKAGKIEGAGNTAKERLSDQDMKDVAEFIQTLK